MRYFILFFLEWHKRLLLKVNFANITRRIMCEVSHVHARWRVQINRLQKTNGRRRESKSENLIFNQPVCRFFSPAAYFKHSDAQLQQFFLHKSDKNWCYRQLNRVITELSRTGVGNNANFAKKARQAKFSREYNKRVWISYTLRQWFRVTSDCQDDDDDNDDDETWLTCARDLKLSADWQFY